MWKRVTRQLRPYGYSGALNATIDEEFFNTIEEAIPLNTHQTNYGGPIYESKDQITTYEITEVKQHD